MIKPLRRLISSAAFLVLTGLMIFAAKKWSALVFAFYPKLSRKILAFLADLTAPIPVPVWELAVCALLWLRVGGRPDVKRLGPYLLCALLPIAWYMALLNHSAEHAFFTYRALCVTIFAAVSMAIPTGKAET